ncbi:hypothetical protein Hanom_Chr12g01180251 [Helianthus anomalus]
MWFNVFTFRFTLRSRFCELTWRNMRTWFNVFTFCFTLRSKFCGLTWRNVRVWFKIFTSFIFSTLQVHHAGPKWT